MVINRQTKQKHIRKALKAVISQKNLRSLPISLYDIN